MRTALLCILCAAVASIVTWQLAFHHYENVVGSAIVRHTDEDVTGYYDENGPILIEGALNIETRTLRKALTNVESGYVGTYRYWEGTYKGYPVVVMKTEEGVSNASVSTMLAIQKFHPSAVISQGTAGGHDPNLHVFDIVIGDKSEPIDAYVTEYSEEGAGVDNSTMKISGVLGYEDEVDKFVRKKEHKADPKLLAAANAVKSAYQKGQVVNGVISTSQEWNNQVDYILHLYQMTGSSCEEMETDSAAVICGNYNVPFIGIRILSNTAVNNEAYDPTTGRACQEFVLNLVDKYIQDNK